MGPREFWAGAAGLILGVDVLLARGEPNGDTFCEVVYVGLHLDRPAPRTALALGFVGLWAHLVKRRPWLDNVKEI